MNTLNRLILVLVVSLFCGFAGAQSVPTSAASGVNPALQVELATAKAELEVTRRFQDQLLSTVFWSLGALAAVAALLVGYSWWNNSRNYDRDKKTFEREIHTIIAEAVKKLTDEQMIAIQSRIGTLKDSLTEQVLASEAAFALSTEAKLKKHKEETAESLSLLKTSLSTAQRELDEIHLTNQLLKREEDVSRGILRNVLQQSVTALEMAVKLGDQMQVGDILDLVSEDVRRILESKERLPIDNFLIGHFVSVLDSITGSHAHSAAGIKAKAASMLLYK